MSQTSTQGRTTCLADIVFPGDTNHHGTLFGGIGLAQMDKAAFIAASRHAPVDFVTASCEQVDFHAPVYLGDIVEMTGRVVRVGRRSLGVETELIAEAPLTGERRNCGRAIYNMVAIGDGLEKFGGCLPPLTPIADIAPDTELRIVEMVFPDQTSHYGSLYGGKALAAMGKAAFISATRHCRKTVILAGSRRVDFFSQIQKGEVMELCPHIVATGRSSITVMVELNAENLQTGERRSCGRGEFTMVAVDQVHRPVSAAGGSA